MRRETANGVYDIYTNQMHYPQNTQPSHARWEYISEDPDISSLSIKDHAAPNGTSNGITALNGASDPKPYDPAFPPISSYQHRNFATIDTHMEFPPRSGLGLPGPEGVSDSGEFDVGPKGLCDVAEDVIACLPSECLGPFMEAREEERKWRAQWGTEKENGMRADIKVTYTAS